MENLSKEEMKQLLSDMAVIKDAYLKELEREKNERDKQATIDSSEAEILAKEVAEEKKLEQERLEKQAQVDTTFRQDVLKSLEPLGNKDTLETLNAIDTKLGTLIEESGKQPKSEQLQQDVSHFTNLSILFFLYMCIPVFMAYRGLSKLFDAAFA